MRSRYVVKPKADCDLDEYADYLTDQGNLEVALRFFTEAYDVEFPSNEAPVPRQGWYRV